VLVDEYQDTNTLQADIVSRLRPDGTGVTCVGDDAQAIYSFRAATVRNILDFELRFRGAEVATLSRNYRSTSPILEATNAIIAEATERRDKQLWTGREGGGRPSLVTCRDEAEQTTWLCDRILDHREQGTLLKHQCVLFRAAHHSMALEMELSRRNIRSTSTAACASWRRRTSRTSSASCALPRTRAMRWQGCACSASSRRRPADGCRADDLARRGRLRLRGVGGHAGAGGGT